MSVKPSGSAMFLLVVLGGLIIGRAVCTRVEHTETRRDTPPAHTVRRLLRCMLGRDAQRVLGATNANTVQWETAISTRLRAIIAAPQVPGWPARCATLAEWFARTMPGPTTRLQGVAHETAALLRAASTDRDTAIDLVEQGRLGRALATLAAEVRGSSRGAEASWTSGLAPAPTDLHPVQVERVPSPAPIAHDVAHAMLAMEDLVVYQSTLDRHTHVVSFDGHDRARPERDLARGAPATDDPREGAVRIVADEGDTLFVPSGEPAALLPMPDRLRDGTESTDAWNLLPVGGSLLLATLDHGIARIRSIARTAPGAWSPSLSVGSADELVGGWLSAASAPDRAWLWTMRRAIRGVRVERMEIMVGASLQLGATTVALPEWDAYSPSAATCVSGTVRWIALRSQTGIDVLRIEGTRITQRSAPFARLGVAVPPSTNMRAHCLRDRAVIAFEANHALPAIVTFDDMHTEGRLLRPPASGPGATSVGVAIASDGSVVVAGANSWGLRAWRSEDGESWHAGGRIAVTDASATFAVADMAALGARVAVLATITDADGTRLVRIASRDGGRSFVEE